MIYYEMVQRLDYNDENRKPEDVRQAFDNEIGITAWKTPFDRSAVEDDRPDGAPSWWVSDEEASGPWLAMAQAQGME